MGYEATRFIHKIDEEFYCPICVKILKDPVQLPCGHLFCSECVKECVAVNRSCPVDGAPLKLEEIKPTTPAMKVFRNQMNKLEIKCDFESNGCKTIVKLENLEGHIGRCEHNVNVEIIGDKAYKCNVIRRQEQAKATNLPPKWRRVHNIIISSIQPHYLIGAVYGGSAQLCYPLSPSNSSFKVEILNKNCTFPKGIGIGLSSSEAGNDCIIYYSNGELNYRKVPMLKAADIIECRINFTPDRNAVDDNYVEIVFLRNGESLAKELVVIPRDGLYPTICMNSPLEAIKYLID